MNITLNNLYHIVQLLEWVLTFGGIPAENVEFYNSVKNALMPYNALKPSLEFLPSSTILLPFNVAADINSVIIEFGERYTEAKQIEFGQRLDLYERIGYKNSHALT
jgi:hypothetical protein